MACWSPENATSAYLKTMKMEKRAKEPDVAEFISALAAGNNAQLMVVACAGPATASTLGLVIAAHQTGGRVICILPSKEYLNLSKQNLGLESVNVEFVVGEALYLLRTYNKEADFMIIDCKLENHEKVFRVVQMGKRRNNTIVVGYNALSKGPWSWGGSETQLLPIGEGLLISKISAEPKVCLKKKSQWIVRVDQFKGEEHVFRIDPNREGLSKLSFVYINSFHPEPIVSFQL